MPLANPETLKLVVGIWAGEQSGRIWFEGRERPCRMLRGEPLGDRDQLVLTRNLSRPATFEETAPAPGKAEHQAAPILWAAAAARAQPGSMHKRTGALLVGGRWLRAATPKLPLSFAVQDLLKACLDERAPLHVHLASRDLDLDDVAAELAALRQLKLIGFRPFPKQRGESRPARERLSTANMQSFDTRTLERRLEQDWQRLSEASDAVVLGVGSDMDPALVRRVGERQIRRYRELEVDAYLSIRGREVAGNLAARVETALEALVGRASSNTGALDQAVARGAELLAKGEVVAARAAFERARQVDPSSDLVAGYFGYLQVIDPDQVKSVREESGLREILRALARSPDSADLHVVAAQAHAAARRPGAARRFAERAQQMRPRDPAIDRLLAELPR